MKATQNFKKTTKLWNYGYFPLNQIPFKFKKKKNPKDSAWSPSELYWVKILKFQHNPSLLNTIVTVSLSFLLGLFWSNGAIKDLQKSNSRLTCDSTLCRVRNLFEKREEIYLCSILMLIRAVEQQPSTLFQRQIVNAHCLPGEP
jgi:hypothetical protein